MRVLALSLLLAAPAGVQAAPAEPVSWSSAAYVQAVLGASPGLQQSRLAFAAAVAGERGAFVDTWFPSLSFTGTLKPAKLARGDRFTFGAWRPPANDISLSPALSWNLFHSFKDVLALKKKQLSRASAAEELAGERQRKALEALNAFYDLLLKEKLLEVAHRNLEVQKQQYELTQDRYQHGMKSLSDLLKTETDWRSSELATELADARRRLSLFKFNTLLDREGDAPASLEASFELGHVEPPDLSDGLRRALLHRPEMIENRLSLETADAAYKLARINAMPSLSLDFDLSHSHYSYYGQTSTGFGLGTADYGLTLTLSLPSGFNFYSQLQDIRAADAAWKSSRESRRELSRSVRQEVFQAHIELVRALRSHEIAVRKEEISQQNLEIVREEYSQGSADVIRLSRAIADHEDAQRERMTAFHDANVNRARYLKAVGDPIWR